ncbi:hypothetical protein AcW1_007395 [Taiwanofungus camphoratus]|nr:hypothetical protein AcW1_007395 [Antrodia cinnamomea]
MPEGLKIVKGIGLFHVHGHQDACFIRYSPSFIPDAGLVDGEILETLWSSLNKVSSSTRGMATSHRKEVLNQHMNDSNWKKIINTMSSLQRKYKNIKPILTDTKRSYQAMEASIDPTLLVQWKQQMGKAQQHRLKGEKAMDVFDVELRKGKCIGMQLKPFLFNIGLHSSALSQANIQLRLAEKEPHLDQDLGEEWDVTEMDNPFEVPSSQGVNPEVEAEYSSLSLPSTTGVDRCCQAGLQVLLQQEMDLREGQANDALHQIQIAIGQKSFLFCTKVRHAKSQQRKTRAWQNVNTIDKTLQHHARVYSKARKALVLLEAPAGLLAKYQVLHREHRSGGSQ